MMEELIQSFIEETRELLGQLEDDLLELEKKPDNKEFIDNIFRIMHTLKGASSMYGFENMQNLTHEFESVYDRIRGGKIKVSTKIIDATLKAKDILLTMLDKKSVGKKAQNLIRSLQAYNTEANTSGNSETEQKKQKSSAVSKGKAYCLLFIPDEAIFERGLNPDNLLEELRQLGETKIIPHEGSESWKKQKEKKVCNTSWEIFIRTRLSLSKIEEPFLFYDQEEFTILEIPKDRSLKDEEYEKYFSQFYGDGISIKEHVKNQLSSLTKKTVEKQRDNEEEKDTLKEEIKDNQLTESQILDNSSTISVSSHKLDELMNLVSELVTSTAILQAQSDRFNDFKLNNTIEDIEKLTKKFRNNALDLRLIPVGTLLNKFNRHVRDLSKSLNKSVNLIIEGQETEIDKTILKSIESPLLHIIRNSIDHGIESPEERVQKGKSKEGLLKITALYSGANVVIQIQDDGRGINLERVRECAIKKKYIQPDQQVTDQELLYLIMQPGFTTNENVSMVSGRGVGMDVVRKELNLVSGSLEIDTEKDLGTFITMKLPTTLSIIDTLMIEISKTQILIPLLEIEYCYKQSRKTLFDKDNNYISYKNELIPYISLREKFNYSAEVREEEMVIII
ncbi:MAG: chemotaxis protein CheA, partial [Bacteroidales bacterium]